MYFVYLFLLLLLLLLRLLLLLLLLLLPLLLNDQIANLFGAFTLFQGKQLCFFLCCKKFLIRPPYSAGRIKTEKKGVSKTIYHIRQNRVLSLEIKLEMASNPQFFLSVFILCFFLFCVFCVSFSSFFVLLLPLLLLLLLLLLPLQCINGYIRVKLG